MSQRNEMPQENQIKLMFGVNEVIFRAEKTMEELVQNCDAREKAEKKKLSVEEFNKRIQELLNYYQQLKIAAIDAKLISKDEISQIETVACKNVEQVFFPAYQKLFQQRKDEIHQHTQDVNKQTLKKGGQITNEYVFRSYTSIFTLWSLGIGTLIYPPLLVAHLTLICLVALDALVTVARFAFQCIKAKTAESAEPKNIALIQEQMQNNLLLKPELKCRQRFFELAQTCKKQHLDLNNNKEQEERPRLTLVKA